MVTQQLERDDVEDTLQAVDGTGDGDRLVLLLLDRVVLAADDDRLSLAGGDLGEGRLDLGVERVTRHDDDNRHVLVDQGERAVLKFTGEDT